MRFTLKQLGYFLAAGEHKSITGAARAIHVSQASISAAVSQLERVFGIQLCVRHHAQGLSLTPAGRELLAEARRLLAQPNELQTHAQNPAGPEPRIAHRFAATDMVKGMVANGFGYALLNAPLAVKRALDGKGFLVRELDDGLRPLRLGLAWRADVKLTRAAEAFLEHSRKHTAAALGMAGEAQFAVIAALAKQSRGSGA